MRDDAARACSRRSTRWATRRPCAPPSRSLDTARSRRAGGTRLVTSAGDVQPRVLTTRGMLIERRERGGRAARERLRRASQPRRPARAGSMGLGLGAARPADRLVGGVGLRRGRRDPDDCASATPGLLAGRGRRAQPAAAPARRDEAARARLAAVRGAAADGGTLLVQTAFFAPRGLLGLAYWYALLPAHMPVFSGMIAGLAAEASRPGAPAGGSSPACTRPLSRGGAAGGLDESS